MCPVAPTPVFKPLVEKKETPITQKYAEIRVSTEKGEKGEQKVDVGMFFFYVNK